MQESKEEPVDDKSDEFRLLKLYSRAMADVARVAAGPPPSNTYMHTPAQQSNTQLENRTYHYRTDRIPTVAARWFMVLTLEQEESDSGKGFRVDGGQAACLRREVVAKPSVTGVLHDHSGNTFTPSSSKSLKIIKISLHGALLDRVSALLSEAHILFYLFRVEASQKLVSLVPALLWTGLDGARKSPLVVPLRYYLPGSYTQRWYDVLVLDKYSGSLVSVLTSLETKKPSLEDMICLIRRVLLVQYFVNFVGTLVCLYVLRVYIYRIIYYSSIG